MPVDHIRYDILVQDALRGMVRNVLADAAKDGLAGDHHFFITFDTTADGVRLSDRLREQYPEEMTIVLQHQFWDLKVTDEVFEVGLSFGGVAERLVIPFAAIKEFADPSVQFTLQFETLPKPATPTKATTMPKRRAKRRSPNPVAVRTRRQDQPDAKRNESRAAPACPQARCPPPQAPRPAPSCQARRRPAARQAGGAEVVRLDRFRKK